MALSAWALPQLAKLLPLDPDSLSQILDYTLTLSQRDAAAHLQSFLGDSPKALEFITSFNSRRQNTPAIASGQQPAPYHPSDTPKAKPRKKKGGLAKLPPPRRPEDYGHVEGGYVKPREEDYMPRGSGSSSRPRGGANKAREESPAPAQTFTPAPARAPAAAQPKPRLPPSAAGQLISDSKPARTSSPKPPRAQKISVQGGTPMHGASTAFSDLDSVIRALEIQTNPSLSSQENDAKRKCNCMATRHALLEAAPNCMNCGKIICVKEGIGPCTFCNHPLLNADEIHSMVHLLKEERGREKMAANNASQRRADIARVARPFHVPKAIIEPTPASASTYASAPDAAETESESMAKAKLHRDRLLAFQAENAKRTTVHDQASDFETPTSGLSQWASPQERALQLKRQQKALREQEWNARPEYEKRQVVASINLSTGKVMRKMAPLARPVTPDSGDSDEGDEVGGWKAPAVEGEKGGAFARNPLLGGLIRPTVRAEREEKGKGVEGERKSTWRRVQDDNADNEAWILDGGAYGGQKVGMDGGG